MATAEQFRMSLQQYIQRGFGQPHKATGMLARWQEDLDHLHRDNEELIEAQSVIMRNNRLSREGRQQDLAELGTETAIKKLAWLGERSARTLEARERLRSLCLDYADRPKGMDPTQAYFREREVRDSLRTHSQHDKEIAFLKAAESLDAESMRALQNGPGGAWIKGDVLVRAEQVYGAIRNPEAWSNLQGVEIYLTHLQGVIQHAARVLLTLGADPVVVKDVLGIQTEEAAHG